jgi:hypothetical protein
VSQNREIQHLVDAITLLGFEFVQVVGSDLRTVVRHCIPVLLKVNPPELHPARIW